MKKVILLLWLLLPAYVFSQSKNCKGIIEDRDDLRDKVTYRSSITEPVVFVKLIVKDTTLRLIRLKAYGSTLSYDGTGVIVKFQDGTKWSKPDAKIDVKVNDLNSYQYTCLINLSPEDVEEFVNKKIQKYGLYIFDNELKEKKSSQYQEMANCIYK